jgi:ATP-dependent Clp protease ATP-binding subunit ClpC
LAHNYIGTEHLLLGLLREETGIGARVLASLGVEVEGVRAQVARIVGHGDEATTGQIPFTPRAKSVLEFSLREALALGHDYIGTEHVLLGLVRQEGVSAQILVDLGVTPDDVRNAVVRELGASGQRVQLHPRSAELPPLPPRMQGPGGLRVLTGVKGMLLGWVLFALPLGIGIAVGWAIWG